MRKNFHENVNILLVDDKPENLYALEELLSDKRRIFFKANSGNEALKIALNNDLALILLDVQMPDMNGFEVAHFLKSNIKTQNVPIVFVTAINKETQYVLKGLEEGAVDYLFKPLNPEITKAKVSSFILMYEQQSELLQKDVYLENLGMLVNNSADLMCILIADNFIIEEVNPSCKNILGYSMEEIKGENLFKFFNSEDARELLDIMNNKDIEDGITIKMELRAQAKEGDEKWLDWSAVYKGGKWFSNARDVTDVRHAGEIKNYLTIVVNQSNDAIYLCNNEGNIISWNGGAEKIYGYDKTEAPQMELWKIIPEDKLTESREVIRKLINGEKILPFETKRITKQGAIIDVMFSPSTVIDANGEMKSIAITERDITQQKKTAEELLKAKELAERSVKVKEQFLANTSHEIRTPMNGIIGFARLFEETPLTPEQKEYVHAIKTSGDNLLTILNDILDISKMESGKIEFEEVKIDVIDLVSSVMLIFKPKATERQIQLNSIVDQKIPKVLKGDPVRLTQVLINFIGNAIKFSKDQGRVIVHLKMLNEDADSIEIEFAVEDTGIGIAEDQLPYIFESFRQANSDTTRKYGGTGLGLTIAKQLIELQGGKITVKSKLDEGTTFFFTLKFKKAGKEVVDKKEQLLHSKKSIIHEELKNINVLLLEDNPVNQFLARVVMGKWGCLVDVAENGRIGLEKLKKKEYDVILMDLQMPEMDGYAATNNIRNVLLKKGVPIIAMTAHAIKGESDKCIEAGMNDYISKPFDPEILYSKMKAQIFKDKAS